MSLRNNILYFNVCEEMGVDVLPHHFPLGRDLEHAPELPFGDQSVAVAQAPRPRDVGAEEIVGWAIPVFPDDLVGVGVDLDHP